MNDDAGDGISKVQKLRESANAFISVMLPTDGIGLVRFNDTAQRLMEIQDAGASPGDTTHITAIGHISGSDKNPAGATSIGDGVVNGKQMLDDAQAAATPDYDVTAMVVLTDGMWNRPPSLADVSGSITANTYAVGLGIPSNISVPALTTLCQGHSGYLLITGTLSPDQSMRLSKYFLQILAGVTNAQIVADPAGALDKGSEHRIPFWICEADFGMDLIVLSPAPYVIDFQLEAPDGTRITPASGSGRRQFTVRSEPICIVLPVVRCQCCRQMRREATKDSGTRSEAWQTEGQRLHVRKERSLPYEFLAHSYSSLTFSAHVSQSSFEIGSTANISASLLEYDAVPRGRASVWAEVRRPDQGLDVVGLAAGPGDRYTRNYSLGIPGVSRLVFGPAGTPCTECLSNANRR